VSSITIGVGLGPLAHSLGHGPQPQEAIFSFLKENYAKFRSFRALDWPSSICVWRVLTKKQHFSENQRIFVRERKKFELRKTVITFRSFTEYIHE